MSDGDIVPAKRPPPSSQDNESMTKPSISPYPSKLTTHEWGDISGLRVASVGTRDAHLNVLVFMGMRACVDPLEMRRYGLLAKEWNARVTVVDTPGFGYGGGKLTRVERVGLRHGNFTEVARRMVRTAAEFDNRGQRGPVTVVGYSLGAGIAAAAAADPGLLRVDRMIAVEPVSVSKRNPFRLVSTARAEDQWTTEHLANGDDHRISGDPVPHNRADLARLGYALTRGAFVRDLLRANHIQRLSLQIVHGESSLICQPDDIDRLVSRCRRSGMDVHDVSVAGRHGLWQSLPDVANLARETRKRWTY